MHQPTTLILGAGSSCDYGYPSGRKLRADILKLSPSDLHAVLPPGPVPPIEEFLRAFKGSRMRSIDAFLARQTRFTDIGKLAIARVLLKCEEEAEFKDVEALDDDWQGYLIGRLLVEKWDDFDPSWLTIVTFNYDRHLEYVLCKAVQDAYGKRETEALQRLEKLKILHVYGSVGDRWQSQEQEPYGAARGGARLRGMCIQAAQCLRVIQEGRDSDESLAPIREALNRSARICFLGFSFDPANVRRLGAPHVFVNSSGQSKELAATVYGMTEVERTAALRSLFEGSQGMPRRMPSTFQDARCEALLRGTLFLG